MLFRSTSLALYYTVQLLDECSLLSSAMKPDGIHELLLSSQPTTPNTAAATHPRLVRSSVVGARAVLPQPATRTLTSFLYRGLEEMTGNEW